MTNGRHTPEVEDEIAKFWAGYQAREEERWRKERGDNKLQISLIPASDDAPTFSPEGQAELRRFSEQVRDDGIKVQSFGMALDAVDAQGGAIGEYLIEFVQAGGLAVLATAIVSWLRARYGRKVKLRFGKDRVEEISAGTPQEIGEVLKHAADFLDRNKTGGDA